MIGVLQTLMRSVVLHVKLIVIVVHRTLASFAVQSACMLHAQQVRLKVLIGINTRAEIPCTQDGVLFARHRNSVDVDFALAETEPIF